MGLKTENLDIVYCVKDTSDDEELRYSLRSLKNIKHRNVWIYGGCPEWVDTDRVKHIYIPQDSYNKWTNTAHLLDAICQNDEISEDFIWFNDDFFVIDKIDQLDYYYDRTLFKRAADFSKYSFLGKRSAYANRLKDTHYILLRAGKDFKNYELHIPMIFNRKKLQMIYRWFPTGAKRSLYGNSWVENSFERKDVKIYDNEKDFDKNTDFVSTTDASFRDGQVGKHLRKMFNKPSKYEKGVNDGKNGRKARGKSRRNNNES